MATCPFRRQAVPRRPTGLNESAGATWALALAVSESSLVAFLLFPVFPLATCMQFAADFTSCAVGRAAALGTCACAALE